jgi:hypothetical protein
MTDDNKNDLFFYHTNGIAFDTKNLSPTVTKNRFYFVVVTLQ